MDLDVSSNANSPSVVGRPLVMAVDDNEDNLLILVHALNIFGFANISTLEGQAVVDLATCHQPDLILLDILMGEINGTDILRQLRQNAATQHIPVIAVTALASAEERKYLLNLGFVDCLPKPYDIDELQHLLESYLSQPSSIV